MTGAPFDARNGQTQEVYVVELFWQIGSFVGMAMMTFAMFVTVASFMFGGHRRAWLRCHREDH